jgi:hypothetical protein
MRQCPGMRDPLTLLRNTLLGGLAAIFLMGSLLSQTDQTNLFGDDKLGMSLKDFNLKPRINFRSKPGANCRECRDNAARVVDGVTECEYLETIPDCPYKARGHAFFVDDKLAAINLYYWDECDADVTKLRAANTLVGERTLQALIATFGNPQITKIDKDVAVPIPNETRRIVRWNDADSATEFQSYPCNRSLSYAGVSEILQGTYCESPDTSSTTISIWYVDKVLSKLIFVRHKELIKN